MNGKDFMDSLDAKKLDAGQMIQRDNEAVAQFLLGNVPNWMRKFITVKLEDFKGPSGTTHTGEVYVSPDFLSIGDDTNSIRFPMTPMGAQKVHDKFETTFPTTKIADAIFKNAKKQLVLVGLGGSPFNKDYRKSNDLIEAELKKDGDPPPRDRIVAGHKKDIILSRLLLNPPTPKPPGTPADKDPIRPRGKDAVVIYGSLFEGKFPHQGESDVHLAKSYEDYSHCVRLVSRTMLVDTKLRNLFDTTGDDGVVKKGVLHDPEVFGLVLAGPFLANFPERYPGT